MAIRGKTDGRIFPSAFSSPLCDQRLMAIRGKTGQLPEPLYSKCRESIMQAPPVK
jgi:hypothetical protein